MATPIEERRSAPRVTARPTLSVLLLCWNHERYLEQCLGALASQERDGLEIIFLDNCSTDGSVALATRLAEELGLPMRLLSNDAPSGIAANFNRLLESSSGDLVAPLSTDDWYAPAYVAALRDAAVEHPEAGFFACNGWLYLEDVDQTRPMDDADFRGGKVLDILLAGGSPFNFVGCCYRRSALQEAGAWDEAMPIEDRDLFVRLASNHPVHVLTARLVTYRRMATSASANPEFMAKGWLAFFAKHRALFGKAYSEQFARSIGATAALAVDQGKIGLALGLLQKVLRECPTYMPAWRTLAYAARSAGRRRA